MLDWKATGCLSTQTRARRTPGRDRNG
jgi:hypothetical protein